MSESLSNSSFSVSAGSTRTRKPLAQMLHSATMRQRLDQSAGHTNPTATTSGRSQARPSAATSTLGQPRQPIGSPMTLDHILTPTKIVHPTAGGAVSGRPRPPSPAERVIQQAMERGALSASAAAGSGPYQYDLYPSAGARAPSPARPSPFAATRRAGSFFYPASPMSPMSTTAINATVRRISPPPRRHSPTRSPERRRRTPSPSKYASTTDIAATQRRIQELMEAQRREAQASGRESSAQSANSSATAPAERSYPLTSALAASKGARTVDQIKRDLALRLHDRTHPDHLLNSPANVEASGIFHLARHSSIAPAAASTYHAGPLTDVTHPLAADGRHADRRATSITDTARPSTVPLTAAQLAANSVYIARSTIPSGSGQMPPSKSTEPPPPVRFFPSGEVPVDRRATSAVRDGQQPVQQPKLPQSAFLATMHAGALRVEHLLAQPRMQAMLDAMLPQQLARDQILQTAVTPPKTSSNVDRLLYDTIKGRVPLDGPNSSALAGSSTTAAAVTGSLTSPASKEPFSRADLLRREARLDALLALSSPEPSTGETVVRMSYDPAEQRRAEELAREESFFEARSILGSPEAAQATTLMRHQLLEANAARYAATAAASADGSSPPSAMDQVLAELLGTPTRRGPKLQVTNLDPAVHVGGVANVLDGITSPLRRAMKDTPTPDTRPTTHQTAPPREDPMMIASDSSALALAAGVADTGSVQLTRQEFEYLESVNSLSPVFRRAAVHDAYAQQLEAKAREFRFVHASHLMRDAWQQWKETRDDRRERARVLHGAERSYYEAWREQKEEPIHELRLTHERRLQQEEEQRILAASSPSSSAAGGQTRSPSFSTSALAADVPSRPVSTAVGALSKKAYIQEESVSRQRELMAELHAEAGNVRRNFQRWSRYARVEAAGKRFALATRQTNLAGWWRNWRDLMRIARGEFHMWAHGKARDAEVDAYERERQQAEKDELDDRRRRREASERMSGEGVERQEVPIGEHLYAGSSRTVRGTDSRSLVSPPPRASPSSSSSSASTGGPLMASSSARYNSHPDYSPMPPDPNGGAPLSSVLLSAYTQEQFWSHQESIWRGRQAEEEARLHFATLKIKFQGEIDGTHQRQRNWQDVAQKHQGKGPLLFQQGTSLRHPTFGIGERLGVQAAPSAGQRRYLSAEDPSNLSITMAPFPLTSPVRTSEGVLHERTGMPTVDRQLIGTSPEPRHARDPSPDYRGERADEIYPTAPERQFTSPTRAAAASPKVKPLRPPAFLQRGGAATPAEEEKEEPKSPMHPPMVPSGSSSASVAQPRPSPSATGHGFLPQSMASSLSSPYFLSSHWQAPDPKSITDADLRANIRISREMARSATETRDQNKIAQWKRIEAEKAHYRQRVQDQHAPSEGDARANGAE